MLYSFRSTLDPALAFDFLLFDMCGIESFTTILREVEREGRFYTYNFFTVLEASHISMFMTHNKFFTTHD